jgi:large subunit ribosomal protein L9
MKVILREEVDNLGNAGDLVNVKPGFARNYLLPRQLAVRADEGNVKALEHQKRAMEARRKKLAAAAGQLQKQVEGVGRVVATRACGTDGRLFGSVTTADIAQMLAGKGVTVDKRHISLQEPLKHLGDFDVTLKLGQGTTATVKVSVEPDSASAEAIAEAAKAAATAPPPAAAPA